MGVWSLLSNVPFHKLDGRIRQGAHHRLLDRIVGWSRGQPLLFERTGFFAGGWGSPKVQHELKDWIREFPIRNPRSIHVQPIKETVVVENGRPIRLWEGQFSGHIDADVVDQVPASCHTARFLLVDPRTDPSSPLDIAAASCSASNDDADVRAKLWSQEGAPAAIMLAGTGEHGYSRRLENVALPLARKGIVSLILESPFYGKRKPPSQFGSKLNQVSDLGLLGRITIEEASALVRFLKVDAGCGPVAVGGVSMGGLHAAMVASLLPMPVGVVSWLVSCVCVCMYM
jgi:hypothetical protein